MGLNIATIENCFAMAKGSKNVYSNFSKTLNANIFRTKPQNVKNLNLNNLSYSKNPATDTVCFSGTANKALNTLSKQQYIEQSKGLKKYLEITNNENYKILYPDSNILNNASIDDLIKIEKSIQEISKK